MRARQLALRFERQEEYCYGNYYPGTNAFAIAQLQRPDIERIYLWGPLGSGKTHLLQAVCQQADARQQPVIYLPLTTLAAYPPTATEGLESCDIICLDDLQAIVGNPAWEEALYTLFNLFEGQLILTGPVPSAELGLRLPDLRSRLAGSLSLALHPLGEAERVEALQWRAHWRGFDLPKESARYLLSHSTREAVFSLLDNLAQASLSAKRRITIPFIKTALELPPRVISGVGC